MRPPGPAGLPVSHFSCCLRLPPSFPQLCCCGLRAMDLHAHVPVLSSMSWPLQWDSQSLSSQGRCLYMVHAFSSPLMVAAWLAWRQLEKLGSGQMWRHTNQGTFRASLRGAGPTERICQSAAGWALRHMAPESFGSCLGLCLEHTGHTVTALTSHCFRGNVPVSAAAALPLSRAAVSAEGSAARACARLGRHLPGRWWVSVPHELGRGS